MQIEHGIVGNDGETHQGLIDMASFSIIPKMTIMAPKDFEELEQMVEFCVNLNSPILLRYPRGGEGKLKFKEHPQIVLGKSELIQDGSDVTIIAIGKMVERAVEVASKLSENKISCQVINARFLKPFDEDFVVSSIIKTKNIITIEDGMLRGGLSTTINEIIAKKDLQDIRVQNFGYDDKFVKHGSVQELEDRNGMNAESIAASWLKENKSKVSEKIDG